MHSWKVIIFTFIVLAFIAIAATEFNQYLKDHYYESMPLEEQEVRKHVRKYFSMCPHPPLGDIQPFIDCHNKMARKDI